MLQYTSVSESDATSVFRVKNRRGKQRLETAQLKFLRTLLGFSKLDHYQRNTEMKVRLQVENIVKDICEC